MTDDQPNPIDIHVGEQIRKRRRQVGLSQQAVAEALGCSFQQIQKYERGTNRISGSRMWQMAGVLGVPVEFFFDGLGRPGEAPRFDAKEFRAREYYERRRRHGPGFPAWEDLDPNDPFDRALTRIAYAESREN